MKKLLCTGLYRWLLLLSEKESTADKITGIMGVRTKTINRNIYFAFNNQNMMLLCYVTFY